MIPSLMSEERIKIVKTFQETLQELVSSEVSEKETDEFSVLLLKD